MIAGSFKTHQHHVYKTGKVDVLKASAIYGANGAGKSNLVKAIEFLQGMVADGYLDHSVNNKKFKLNQKNIKKPVSFELEMYVGKKIYNYGIRLDQSTVIEEWLYESGVKSEDKMIFERTTSKTGRHEIKLATKFQKNQKQKFLKDLIEERLLKPNELLIGKSETLRISDISKVREKIVDQLIIIHPSSKFLSLVPLINTSDEFKNFSNDLLQTFDTGVSRLDIQSIDFEKFFGDEDEDRKNEIIEKVENDKMALLNTNMGRVLVTKEKDQFWVKKVISIHKDTSGSNISFDLEDESDGTQRLLDFIPAFFRVLSHESIFIIDEIDQSLHPALLKVLIRKIMAEKNTKGQLIFTTHESNLLDLDIFRQDEIWFTEKQKNTGGTQIYSLSEFKPRYDLDIRKGYLKGRFGAIPFLANLEDLNWSSYDA